MWNWWKVYTAEFFDQSFTTCLTSKLMIDKSPFRSHFYQKIYRFFYQHYCHAEFLFKFFDKSVNKMGFSEKQDRDLFHDEYCIDSLRLNTRKNYPLQWFWLKIPTFWKFTNCKVSTELRMKPIIFFDQWCFKTDGINLKWQNWLWNPIEHTCLYFELAMLLFYSK